MPLLPWIGAGMQAISSIFDRSKGGYENSPSYRAYQDSIKNEQRIFERDSAYNSPKAQMQRYADAGLNPNLIYGQGTPGNSTGSAVQSSGNVPKLDLVADMMQSLMMGKEMELKDAQIASINKNTELADTKIGSENWKQERARQDYEYLRSNYPELLQKLQRENKFGEETYGINVETKTRENQFGKDTYDFKVSQEEMNVSAVGNRLERELKQMELMEKDGKIRDEVLKSKEFQTTILRLQKEFLEGNVNPQMFFQALMSILVGSTR